MLPKYIRFMSNATIKNNNDEIKILTAILCSLNQMNDLMTQNNQMLKDIDYKMHKLLINTNS